MINFNDYEFIKRPKSDLAADKILSNIYHKWWNDKSYNTVYYLGAIAQLKAMVKGMKDGAYVTKKDLLRIIAKTKTYPEVSNEIKNLIDDILEEFDYKENDK